jgi:hypothetical protein
MTTTIVRICIPRYKQTILSHYIPSKRLQNTSIGMYINILKYVYILWHLRLRTCIYFYYMLSPKKMCEKMFSYISTYTNSIYMLSTIVNTQINTKKNKTLFCLFFRYMRVFDTTPTKWPFLEINKSTCVTMATRHTRVLYYT